MPSPTNCYHEFTPNTTAPDPFADPETGVDITAFCIIVWSARLSLEFVLQAPGIIQKTFSESTHGSTTNPKQAQVAKKKEKAVFLPYLRTNPAFLLDLCLWFSNMLGVHGGKPVGDDLQRDYLELP